MSPQPHLFAAGEITTHFPLIAQLILGFVLFGYVIYSIVIFYHWFSYGTDHKVNTWSMVAYFIITLPILALTGFSYYHIAYVI